MADPRAPQVRQSPVARTLRTRPLVAQPAVATHPGKPKRSLEDVATRRAVRPLGRRR